MMVFHLSTAYFGAEAAGMSTHLTIILMVGMLGMMAGMMYFMHGKGSGEGKNCCDNGNDINSNEDKPNSTVNDL